MGLKMKKLFCKVCEHEQEIGDDFCQYCGESIIANGGVDDV